MKEPSYGAGLDAGSRGERDLRKEAEVAARLARVFDAERGEARAADTRSLLHDLFVHEIELELQNEELRATQVELDTLRARYFDLFDLAPVGYVVLDALGVIIEANLTMSTLVGVPRGEVVGRALAAFVVPEDQDTLYLFRKRIATSPEFRVAELRLKRQGGGELWSRLEASPSTDEAGSGSFRLAVSDITALRRAAREREEIQEQLVQSQKLEALGQLAGGIAHDFNNLLGSIILPLDMLRRRSLTTEREADEALSSALESARRATDLTRQLLLFCRRQPMKKARHDANVVAVDTMRLLARLLGENIAISVEQSPEPLWFDGDAGMIGQVLTNLSLNARDAMPNGGRLTVRVSAAQPEDGERPRDGRTEGRRSVCLAVEDSGSGIAPAVLPHIFEPFFTTKSVGRGTGLGLATAHGIVANHGGFMEVDSRVGAGTTFRVYLPIAETAVVEAPPPSSTASVGGTERILLVEDEPAVRWVSARCLRRLGYRVTEATSGVEALEIWADEAGEFDLLFTDMVMPGGISGADLCARFRAEKPTLRTLITSAYSAERLGAPDSPTLQKPYDVATLAAAIRACLDSAETVRAPEIP